MTQDGPLERSASVLRSRIRGLQGRLLTAFLGVALVPLALLAVWTVSETSGRLAEIQEDRLRAESSLVAQEVEKAIVQARLDLKVLSDLPVLEELRATGPLGRSPGSVRRLAEGLERSLERQFRYAAAVYIDDIGDEVARVQRTGDEIAPTPARSLHNVALDPLIRDLRRMLVTEGQMSFGTLTRETRLGSDRVVVRILTRLFERGQDTDASGIEALLAGRVPHTRAGRGLLALDLDVDAILAEIRERGVGAKRILLIDTRGAYREQPANAGDPVGIDLVARYPAVAAAIEAGESGLVRDPQIVAAVLPIQLDGDTLPWYVAVARARTALKAPLARTRRVTGFVLLGSLALAYVLASVVAGRLSRPILQLARSADELGRGQFDRPVRVHTGDEIEDLSVALERMAHELRDLYHNLELRIRDKTTELREANAELRHAYDELQEAHGRLQESEAELVQAEKLSSIGRLAASIAHEINNPVGIISMYAQMLREESHDDQVRATLDTILESAAKVSATVGGLLDFSRRAPSRPVAVDLTTCVSQARDEVAALAGQGGVSVDVDLPASAIVSGDRAQLRQVFRNLLENASHAMGGQGTVTITGVVDGDHVEVTIDDHGPGIPEDLAPRVFEPFFTTKPGSEGTGLGLAVSYGIVRSHQGSIRVAAAPSGGARFVIRLPLDGDADGQIDSSSTRP